MNERKWHEWNSTFPQWKEQIVEIELVHSHFPSHILKGGVLHLPPLLLPSFALACFRIRRRVGGEKNRVTSFTGYQLGSFGDILPRINDKRPMSRCSLLVGFGLRWPRIICSSWATAGAAALCRLISSQFSGIAQFSTHPVISSRSPSVSGSVCS